MAARCYLRLFNSSPIIVILGATGTGKSKLAIELAKKFNGEIINGDAMQMYQGLDIATNKVTLEEQDGITHHLLGFLEPRSTLTALKFRNRARKIIKEIIDRKHLPVIVGGTYYYIESILYDMLIDSMDEINEKEGEFCESENDDSVAPNKKLKTREDDVLLKYQKLDNAELHQKLCKMDPEAAETVHPNDRRKVLRSVIKTMLQKDPFLTTLKIEEREMMKFGIRSDFIISLRHVYKNIHNADDINHLVGIAAILLGRIG